MTDTEKQRGNRGVIEARKKGVLVNTHIRPGKLRSTPKSTAGSQAFCTLLVVYKHTTRGGMGQIHAADGW